MDIKNKSKLILPGLFLILTTAFFYVPHLVYFPNREAFPNYFIPLIYPLLIVSSLCAIGLWLIMTLLPNKILKYITSILMVSSLLLWFQGDLFAISYGALDGSIIDFDRFESRGNYEIILIFLAVLLALVFQKFINKQLPFILVIIVLGQISLVSYKVFTEPNDKKINKEIDPEFFNYSSKKNVIFIILDTFGADYFNRIKETDPALVKDLAGFVNYTDAISNYPATKGSLPSIMIGKMIENINYRDFLKKEVANKGLPAMFDKMGYLVSVISVYRYMYIYATRFISSPHLDIKKVKKFNAYKLLDFSLFRISPQVLKPMIYNHGLWKLSGTLANQQEIPNTPAEKGVYMFNLMTENATVKDSQKRFKLIHVLLPHPELVYDSDCKKSQIKTSVTDLMLFQSKCAIKKLNEYLNKLKELGIYDSSLIVVVSDHGARIITDKSIHGFPSYFELATSGVLFMIKGINQKQQFQDVDSPVSLKKLYDMFLNEDIHTQKIDFLNDNDRLFYSFQNNSPGDKSYLPDAPLFKVSKNYLDPQSWELDKIVTHNCPSQPLPSILYFTKNGRENYCAKFGFSYPESNGSGAWTESNDVRIIVKLDLTKKQPDSNVNFIINFKPLIKPKQKELKLSWYINDNLVKSQTVNKGETIKTQIHIPTKTLKLQEQTVLKIKISTLTSFQEMGLNTDTRKLGLFISSIEIE